jgi:hypothetical protein
MKTATTYSEKKLFSINLWLFRPIEYLIQIKMQLKDEFCDNCHYSPSERVIHNHSQGNIDKYLDSKTQENCVQYYAGKGCNLSYGK